jgi:hypothetical protein
MRKADGTSNGFCQSSSADASSHCLYSNLSHQPKLFEIDSQQSSSAGNNNLFGEILKENEEKKRMGKRNPFMQIRSEEELKRRKSKGGGGGFKFCLLSLLFIVGINLSPTSLGGVLDSHYEAGGDFTTAADEEYVVREDSPNSVLSQVYH